VAEAVQTFERNEPRITALDCRRNALRLGVDRFRREFFHFATDQWEQFRDTDDGRFLPAVEFPTLRVA
jgi:hypothetical protein